MYDGHRVGVVIPAHNEAAFIGEVIEAIPAYVDRTYVIDDASTDGTWDVIQRRAETANTPRQQTALADGGKQSGKPIVPIRNEINSGRGGAIKTGYHRALEDGMDVIAVIDGDGQHDPAILQRFLDPIVDGRADYAKGNRLLSTKHRKAMSRWRLFGNTLLTYFTKIASGYWRMMDPQNGYTVIRDQALRSIDIDGLYNDYGFLNDLLVKLNVADKRIVDVGMRARYGDEESGIRYSRFIPKLSTLLIRNFIWRLRTKYLLFDFHPLVGLYVLGGLAVAGAGLFFGWTAGSSFTSVNAFMVFLLVLLGGLFFTLAMIYDRAHNVGLEERINEGLEGDVR